MTVYMAVTADEYELPIAIEDSYTKLAKRVDMNRANVIKAITNNMPGKRSGIRFYKVEID